MTTNIISYIQLNSSWLLNAYHVLNILLDFLIKYLIQNYEIVVIMMPDLKMKVRGLNNRW